jgi:hypothetical protein
MQHNFIHSQPKEWRIIVLNEYNAKKSSRIIESDFWADAGKLSPGGVCRRQSFSRPIPGQGRPLGLF